MRSDARTVRVTSDLDAAAPAVWARVTSFAGINDELSPVLRMTAPKGLRDIRIDEVALRVRVCRSWLLLGGLVPVGYDDVTIAELEPGRRFVERSPMSTMRRWEHERTVEPVGSGCRVVDRLTVEPRLSVLAPVVGGIVAALFRHRHRRLRRRFETSRA